MSPLDILLLSIALAMDCFTVSIVSGVITGRWLTGLALRMAVLFGLFQALMPFIGWMGTNTFSHYLEHIDHWVAFALLAFIGGKMVKDAFSSDDGHHSFNPRRLRTQLVLAVATSIDALAVGISMACLGYTSIGQLTWPLAAIGITSLLLSIVGYLLGITFGHTITRRLKPDLIGGTILILIGIKILITHLG